jgi:putative transposase
MRRGRFTEDQIIAVLREHEAGVKTAELCRKRGISDATFYNWKAKYGGMTVGGGAVAGLVGLRPAVPHAQRHRQLQPGMPGMHRRHLAIGSAGRSRAKRHRRASRAAVHGGQRQRHQADQSCRPRLVSGHRGRVALHRPGEAAAEWLCGIVQWSLARRVFERTPVPLAGCGETDHRGMAGGLQHCASAQQSWRDGSCRVRTAPARSIWKPKLSYQRPENGEQVSRATVA